MSFFLYNSPLFFGQIFFKIISAARRLRFYSRQGRTGVPFHRKKTVAVDSAIPFLCCSDRHVILLYFQALGIALERGAVVTDRRMRTNVPGVWAIGDCNGKLMLAHTAYREAEVAVNDMLGKKDTIDYSIIPSVIYTTPEVACVGETEQSAKEKGLDVQVVKAPMALSGRYLAENPKGTGFCKLLYDRKNRCVVGVHMVGSYVSEIIYGAAMMVHSKLPVQHLDKIVFPHPTVGEVVREALFLL